MSCGREKGNDVAGFVADAQAQRPFQRAESMPMPLVQLGQEAALAALRSLSTADRHGQSANVEYTSLSQFSGLVDLYKGSVSTVYKGTHNASGRAVVVKTYHKAKMVEKHFHKLAREVAAMRAMRGSYVVELCGTFEDAGAVYLIMDWCEGGDLFKRMLLHGGRLQEHYVCVEIVTPLLRVLEKMHSLNLLHRDIKPENIFLTASGKLRLGDFGLAIDSTQELPFSRSGTLDYMAPEVLRNPATQLQESPNVTAAQLQAKNIRPYTGAVDVWAVGVLAYELVCGKPPFEVEDESQTATLIMYSNSVRFPQNANPAWVDFVRMALTKDPKQRPSATSLLQHQWVLTHTQHALTVGAATGRRATKEDLMAPLLAAAASRNGQRASATAVSTASHHPQMRAAQHTQYGLCTESSSPCHTVNIPSHRSVPTTPHHLRPEQPPQPAAVLPAAEAVVSSSALLQQAPGGAGASSYSSNSTASSGSGLNSAAAIRNLLNVLNGAAAQGQEQSRPATNVYRSEAAAARSHRPPLAPPLAAAQQGQQPAPQVYAAGGNGVAIVSVDRQPRYPQLQQPQQAQGAGSPILASAGARDVAVDSLSLSQAEKGTASARTRLLRPPSPQATKAAADLARSLADVSLFDGGVVSAAAVAAQLGAQPAEPAIPAAAAAAAAASNKPADGANGLAGPVPAVRTSAPFLSGQAFEEMTKNWGAVAALSVSPRDPVGASSGHHQQQQHSNVVYAGAVTPIKAPGISNKDLDRVASLAATPGAAAAAAGGSLYGSPRPAGPGIKERVKFHLQRQGAP